MSARDATCLGASKKKLGAVVAGAVAAALTVGTARADLVINNTTTFSLATGNTANVTQFNQNAGSATINGTLNITNNMTLNGGILAGQGTINAPVLAGSGAHTIVPSNGLSATSVSTLTMNALTTSSNTSFSVNLVTPNVAGGSDLINVTGSGGLTLNGGAVVVANHTTGAASLGYYRIMQYAGTIGGTGIAGISLPATVNNIKYVLDTTHDPGYVDLHRGYLGDTNDSGFVDLTDLTTLAGNWQQSGGWSQGDFDGSGFIDLTDLTILAGNWQTGIGAFGEAAESVDPGNMSFQEAVASIVFGASVPEPASLALLGVGAVVLLGKRRRS